MTAPRPAAAEPLAHGHPGAGALTVLTREELDQLNRFVLYAFALRAVAAVLLDWTGYSMALAPDESTYATNGWYLSLYWTGDLLLLPERMSVGDIPKGYFYVNGIFSWLFGQTQIPIKLFNAFLGAFTGRYVCFLARGLYGRAVGRRSTALFLFFPSMILWSSLNIRDVWVIFLIVLISWRTYVLLDHYSNAALLQVIGAIFALSLFRDHLFFAVAMPPVIALLIGRRGNVGRNLLLSLLVAGAVLTFLEHGAIGEGIQGKMSLEALSTARRNLATGGSAFQESVSISTPTEAVAFLPIGIAYFLWSPFPWQITSLLKAFAVPEMLVVYYLTPAMIRGLVWTIRFRLRESLQVLFLTALLTLTYALGEGNIGTLYRHRAQAAAFYLMFAAVGLELRRSSESAAAGQLTGLRPART